ncbi:MAG TPA: nicotinate (nicotinamide) nucleotide adenylyltransferase [Polyangiaceae bacterium LLY-WYZ-15_(1-7)]|nr:nicotinate (nicotinamide) nucleotide adenylyltransferase [Sandaracinus sp.]HJL05720.1 nicotinate (nicotinamide) nucleotide adenylyltransferase [Polyangiaceae bacterium LLY-WYZ-15_(1-7)]HJL08354.1 nicotinate (nicotinamide) nucleotide adenylyltransferase [Polyangiaceae bacterium LLY-WYZ-15_(1-7)]HJL32208.1 nicotinate (nicotinamide) nucleotide adenylyltransferase [Polyangiaceae bacterium LLY-WYZ-15_(1-7)]HJL38660.1 nicotinate (nicotinamide) nucleotide adenylyltransferase [Polyangiaceae bacteriu
MSEGEREGAGPVVAVFGGSFDPPHVGHVLVACWARVAAAVDEVLVVPTYAHAFGKRSAPYADRRAMLELALEGLRGVRISDVERDLGGESSRTLHTLQALAKRTPGARFRLVIGADILAETHRWHRWEDVAALAPPLVVGRGGYPLPDECPFTMPEISSTEVRRRLQAGERAEGLVPPAVLAYARDRGLYREAP